jgi:hypothetical protein
MSGDPIQVDGEFPSSARFLNGQTFFTDPFVFTLKVFVKLPISCRISRWFAFSLLTLLAYLGVAMTWGRRDADMFGMASPVGLHSWSEKSKLFRRVFTSRYILDQLGIDVTHQGIP